MGTVNRWKIPLRILAVVGVAEITVMVLIDNLIPVKPGAAKNVLDALALIALTIPFLRHWSVKELRWREQGEKEVRLLQTATRAVMDSRDFQSALELILRAVCEETGWVLGEAWAPSTESGRLNFLTAWSGQPDKVKSFIENSRKFSFAPGTGLPGRAWKTQKPVWVPDVTGDSNFPRASLAREAGLKGAMSIPVLAYGKFVVIMDFFVFETRMEEDKRLINIVSTAAAQLGAFMQRKLAEDERKKLEEQLLQSQKMEAIGLLAGGMAHDFNNLLTLIVGYNDFLLEGLPPGERLHSFAGEIKKAADGASALTKQLLSFSRKQIVFPREIDINASVSEMGKMLKRLVGENIEIVTVLAPGLRLVKADPGQMEQVILNLAVNARDAMPGGGRLIIETANIDLAENPLNCSPADNAVRSGSHVLLKVKDTGTGIDPVILPRIFEPFFTTKEPGKGTGLGLSTVYGIIKQSGGCVTVESRPGDGSAFLIYLPATGTTEAAADRRETPAAARGSGETILVVEDNADLRTLIETALAANGYRVLQAAGAVDAMGICRNGAGKIHLMLTDLLLPGINGLELAQQISAAKPEIKILYMSGYAGSAEGGGAVPPGAVLINKPFTPETLTRSVRKALDNA